MTKIRRNNTEYDQNHRKIQELGSSNTGFSLIVQANAVKEINDQKKNNRENRK